MNKIDRYIEAYFDGSATLAQERRLKRFLASGKGQDSRYDEVRAVVSYFAAGKAHNEPEAEHTAMSPMWKIGLATALACCIAAALVIGNISGQQPVQEDACWAYIGGKRITDRQVVMDEMESTLSELMSMHSEVYEQLDEFFGK